MRREEFEREEENAHDLIEMLSNLSRHTSVPPDFLSSIMTRAEQTPVHRSGTWMHGIRWIRWPEMSFAKAAVVILFGITLLGAIPQYVTWLRTYSSVATSEQEELWQKNADCSLNLTAQNYRSIEVEGRQIEVLVCPSGDVLVKVGPPDSEQYEYLYRWIALDALKKSEATEEQFWGFLLQQAWATEKKLHLKRLAAETVRVLCQKRLSHGFIKRRLQYANGQCQDEVINTRNGKVVERKNAPCDISC